LGRFLVLLGNFQFHELLESRGTFQAEGPVPRRSLAHRLWLILDAGALWDTKLRKIQYKYSSGDSCRDMGHSYSIRLMKEGDAHRSVALTNLMNWGLEVDDFSFMMQLEPKGCFVAVRGDDVIGVTTSISFGPIGWIGNVIVEPKERKKGVGAALVSEALQHLKAEGVATVGLYSYWNTVSFYESLGFKADRNFSWLVCRKASWKGKSMTNLDSRDLQVVVIFDEQCFGASRKRLLKAIYHSPIGICHAILEGDKPVTYLMATRSATSGEIGPWICLPGREEDGFRLVRALGKELLGREVHLGVPSDRVDVVDLLSSLGFVEDFPVVRMVCGPVPPDWNCVLAIESLERG